jgi:D-alanyl-lipoteichoic acid acyltransferase DltB (MBOAT superfamily)
MFPHSIPYIFILLPVTLFAYFQAHLFRRYHRGLVILILSSVIYYGWAQPVVLLVLVGSLFFNFLIGRALTRSADKETGQQSALLWLGISGNVLLLAYFKYTHFIFSVYNSMAGTSYYFHALFLPIGISFYTFTQIMYLMDAHNGMAERYSLLHYAAYVTFFPYVLAGPMATHREIIPQLADEQTHHFHWENFSIGMTLFFIGLFKKVVFADAISDYSTPVFNAVAHGARLTFFESWFGALAYTAQLYFDFSGYTDMAIGAARLFGIKLPTNFNSPYKAVNIIDFWGRWHMTLTRFLTNYIYNPTVLAVVRHRIKKGKPTIQKGQGTVGAFLMTVAFPTLLTMFISGLWHGAGWTFIIFGMLHGIYLVLNHGWHMVKRRLRPPAHKNAVTSQCLGRVFTFIGVVISFVYFRADTLTSAHTLLRGMFLGNGVSLPKSLAGYNAPLTRYLTAHHVFFNGMTFTPFVDTVCWVLGLFVIIWAFPNSQQWLGAWEPILGSVQEPVRAPWAWKPSYLWAMVGGFMTMIALWAVIGIARPAEFLYFKF